MSAKIRMATMSERFKYKRIYGREWHWHVPAVINPDCRQMKGMTEAQRKNYLEAILAPRNAQ